MKHLLTTALLVLAFSQTAHAFDKHVPQFRSCRFRAARVTIRRAVITVSPGLGRDLTDTLGLVRETTEPVLNDLQVVGRAPVYYYAGDRFQVVVHLADIYSGGRVFDPKQKVVEITDNSGNSGLTGYCYLP